MRQAFFWVHFHHRKLDADVDAPCLERVEVVVRINPIPKNSNILHVEVDSPSDDEQTNSSITQRHQSEIRLPTFQQLVASTACRVFRLLLATQRTCAYAKEEAKQPSVCLISPLVG